MSWARRTRKISWQYLRSGLSRVEPSAAAGRRRDRLEIVLRFLAEVDEFLVDDAAHAVQRAVDVGDRGEPARLERDADQRLVDDGRRPAALRHQNLVRHVVSAPCSNEARLWDVPKVRRWACSPGSLSQRAPSRYRETPFPALSCPAGDGRPVSRAAAVGRAGAPRP